MRLFTVLARTSRLAWGVIAGHLVATILRLLAVLSVAYYFWVGYREMRAPSVEPAAT